MPCNFLTILNDDSVKATLDGTDKQFSSGKLAAVYRQENLITMIKTLRAFWENHCTLCIIPRSTP